MDEILTTYSVDNLTIENGGVLTHTANFRDHYYHTATDTPETLDYEFPANVTRALVATLVEHTELH